MVYINGYNNIFIRIVCQRPEYLRHARDAPPFRDRNYYIFRLLVLCIIMYYSITYQCAYVDLYGFPVHRCWVRKI